jgi:hypothetical protein
LVSVEVKVEEIQGSPAYPGKSENYYFLKKLIDCIRKRDSALGR